MVTTKVYVEGGGDSKALRTECRRGFKEFLSKAGLAGRLPRVVACGGRQNAFDSFCTAAACDVDVALLLVDAEGPVTASGPWKHLRSRDGWVKPRDAIDDQCHLMVECMEAWFLTDRPALEHFYGQSFRPQALPANPNVEQVSKSDLLRDLKKATRDTQKGEYDKGSHSFPILAALNPEKVEGAAPYGKRFLRALRGC